MTHRQTNSSPHQHKVLHSDWENGHPTLWLSVDCDSVPDPQSAFGPLVEDLFALDKDDCFDIICQGTKVIAVMCEDTLILPNSERPTPEGMEW